MAATQEERSRLLDPLDTDVNGGSTVDLSPTPRTSLSLSEQHELPILAPLSHSHPQLTSTEPFDVDSFLLSRSNLSLQDLRSELRGYLAELKEELVQLINDDYAAFISLSTDLKGEGVRLDRIHKPLGVLKDEIEKSRAELHGVQAAVQEKLAERGALREEKATLHLLLKLSDSVLRLESLLLIASSDQGASQTSVDFSGLGIRDMNGLSLPLGDDDGKDDRSRGGQAKHLSRVATEYTQLLYHAEKAREEHCVFVEEIQWRIDRIKTTLCKDLDHLFANTLTSLTSSTVEAASVTDKARWTSDLTECLRTYDVLRNWRDAEEVVRRDLVRPFVKNTIFSGALNVAPSPILVRTLLPGRTGLMSPRTPFTPFTGVRGNPFDSMSVEAISLLTEEEDDALAGLYNTILRFVQVNCTGVMELAEKIAVKTRKNPRKLGMASLPSDRELMRGSIDDLGLNPEGFEIMANVIWSEIGRSIMEELGSTVFAAGNADEFQKNYTTSNNFITALEHLSPSLHAIEMMREHPTYVAFQRRWQLPVYFQLRWKEIVGKVEDTLANPNAQRSKTIQEDFVSPQASAFYEAIRECWSHQVFIPELSHRFWRLTLQLLSRYKSWLESTLPAREAPIATLAPLAGDKGAPTGSSLVTRTATPTPGPAETAESAAADELTLQRFSNAFIDISAMERRVWVLWKEEIGILLPETSVDEDSKSPQEVLRITLQSLSDLLPGFTSQIIAILTRRCSETLSLVRSIPSQYRATSKKRDPTGPSYFVPNILQPVRQFLELDGLADLVDESERKAWASEVFEVVASRYTSYLDAMKKTEDSLRKYKKGKIWAPSLFGGGSSRDEEGKDEERIRTQIVLDVKALGEDAKRLGVGVDNSEAYKTLYAAASSPLE